MACATPWPVALWPGFPSGGCSSSGCPAVAGMDRPTWQLGTVLSNPYHCLPTPGEEAATDHFQRKKLISHLSPRGGYLWTGQAEMAKINGFRKFLQQISQHLQRKVGQFKSFLVAPPGGGGVQSNPREKNQPLTPRRGVGSC